MGDSICLIYIDFIFSIKEFEIPLIKNTNLAFISIVDPCIELCLMLHYLSFIKLLYICLFIFMN